MPGRLLVTDVVQRLDDGVGWLAQAEDRQVARPIEHIIVEGAPLVAVDDVGCWRLFP